LAGYDLDILHLLFQSSSNVVLVGDPRQVTYLTHHENRYGKYKDGKIKEFIIVECKKPITYSINEDTLNTSHRNNKAICDFSSKLYAEGGFNPIEPCNCEHCRNYDKTNEGIHLIRPSDVENYLSVFNPIQLRWDIRKEVHPEYPVYNFGESKGKTFHRVLIYPTEDMENWVYNNSSRLAYSTKAKFYVAITRARFSVGIVTNFQDGVSIDGVQLFSRIENE
jgi:DNA helicase-2/ATP-dependent DNA helicase PcrA